MGAAAGILVAVASVIRPSGDALPADAVATVNDRIVSAEELDRAIGLLARDKRNEMTDEDRAYILSRLVDEELLVQRGIEIGLVESDQAVRKAIVKAMMDSILLDAESDKPPAAALRVFHRDTRDYCVRPPTVRVRQILFRSGEEGLQRAEQAAAELAKGKSFADVASRAVDAQPDSVRGAAAGR
jgi:parvulin-like peptidyl-prolyl isomerase